MLTTIDEPRTRIPRPRTGENARQVLSALSVLCDDLEPGSPFPHHTELMGALGASERTVLWALSELQFQGRILRRRGSKTRVAQSSDSLPMMRLLSDHQLLSSEARKPLSVGSTRVVAMLKPDNYFFSQAAALLFEQVEDRGLTLACHYVNPQTGTLPQDEEALGYVMFGQRFLPWARQLQEQGHRVALFGEPIPKEEPGVPNVRSHQERGGFMAARHLLGLGHRRLLFFGDDASMTSSPRWAGHQLALAEARRKGASIEEFQLTLAEFRQWCTQPELAHAYFAAPNAPTGIVTWNDDRACEMMAFLQYIGISIPKQVSIVGYDALPVGELAHPSLTTIDGIIEEQLRSVLEILTSPMPVSPHHSVVVLPMLVARQSTAPVSI